MKNTFSLFFILFFCFVLYSQVGINTSYPKGIFHVDAAGNNPTDGSTPDDTVVTDDLVISSTGVVSIGTIDPSPYSALEIESTTKGLRLPQLTTTQISELDALSTDTSKKGGLLVYNTTEKCIYFWNDTDWVSLCD